MLCFNIQCNLDLVTLLVSAKTFTKSHNVTKSNDFNSRWKNGLCKMVTKSLEVVTYLISLNRDCTVIILQIALVK